MHCKLAMKQPNKLTDCRAWFSWNGRGFMDYLKTLKMCISINTQPPRIIFARNTHIDMIFRLLLTWIFLIINPWGTFLISIKKKKKKLKISSVIDER